MAERRAIVSDKVLSYKGKFNTHEMYKVIDSWFSENGFSGREEVEHMEKIEKDHKTVEILYHPTKKFTPYAKAEIRMLIAMDNLTREVIEVDGRKTTLSNGDLKITIDGFVTTDYEGRMEMRPRNFLWRTIIDKLLKKNSMGEEYDGVVASLVNQLYGELNSFLKGK